MPSMRVSPLFVAASLAHLACAGQPDYGTLPVISVPLEDEQIPEKKPVPQKKEARAVSADLPDPAPVSSTHQLRYVLAFEKGEISVRSVKRVELAHATPTVRRVGRFALELWLGRKLLERVRFDFPLLGATQQEGDQAIEDGLSTETQVMIPELENALVARILDRKTRRVVELDWPPLAPVSAE